MIRQVTRGLVWLLPLLCALASSVRCADLDDGFYAISQDGTAPLVLTQTGKELRLGEKVDLPVTEAWLSSKRNDNKEFYLLIEMPYEAAPEGSPWHLLLVVGGKVYEQTSSGSSGRKTSSLGLEILSAMDAREVAKRFSIQPRYRVHPGHRLLIEFVPKKKEFAKKESVLVAFRLTNLGDNTIAFTQGGMNRAKRDNQYSFVGSYRGKQMQDIGTDVHFGGQAQSRILGPGESLDDEVDLSKWFRFTESGTYQIVGSYYMRFLDRNDKRHVTVWQDYATAAFSIKITKDQ